MSKVLWLLVFLALGLAWTAPATARPLVNPPSVVGQRFSLVDALKVEHASLSLTTFTREVVLYANDASGVEVSAQDGSQIEVNALSHSVRMGAASGVDIWRGPLTVGATVNADGGYQVAGTPGWSGAVPLPDAACLIVQGGLVIEYRPPGLGCP